MEVLSHTNGTDHVPVVQLPPISSFDSLIRAASATSGTPMMSNDGHTSPHSNMILGNGAGFHYNAQAVRVPGGTDPILSYHGPAGNNGPVVPMSVGTGNSSGTGSGVGTGSTTPRYRSPSASQFSRTMSYSSMSSAQPGMPMMMPVSTAPLQYDGFGSHSMGEQNHTNHNVAVDKGFSVSSETDVHLNVGGRETGAMVSGMVKKQPRKKKQCPICGLFFSNLSTHKSTHLSPETRPFKCEVCSRGFARSNDLIRHKKLHWKDDLNQESMDFVEKLKCLHQLKGTYKCPFNSNLIDLDLELKGSGKSNAELPFETSNCHSTGVFSRCDTFKNHLKALHFEYPPGTKKKDRGKVAGHCKHCGKKFANIDLWLKEHVGKECGYNFSA